MNSKEEIIFICKIAEQAERFQDIANNIGEIIQQGYHLKNEERNLFSVAFKNIVGQKRASLRVLANYEKEEEKKILPQNILQRNQVLLQNYRQKIVKELNHICHQVLQQLQNYLLKSAESSEEKVFYHKMKGDYYKYISEFSNGEEKIKSQEASAQAYNIAQKIVNTEYKAADPIRLGNALSFSVFTYEILNDPKKAYQIAKQAFDSAILELDDLENDKYRDSTLILQLLRDNLAEWTMNIENHAEIKKD